MRKSEIPGTRRIGFVELAGFRPNRYELNINLPGTVQIEVIEIHVDTYIATWRPEQRSRVGRVITDADNIEIQGPISDVLNRLHQRFAHFASETWRTLASDEPIAPPATIEEFYKLDAALAELPPKNRHSP